MTTSRTPVTGGDTARPDTLKVTVGYRAGWIGETRVSVDHVSI